MADKQIGIKLDVKQTGLQQVDDALDTISKNLKTMNDSVIKQQQKGWGSESQTKELREQLRYMQQMTQLYERIARTQGRDSSSFGNFRSEISGMQRDLGSVPSYRTGRLGGYVHERFGERAAQGLDRAVSMLTKAAAAYSSFNILSTAHSGLARGDQIAFGYADVAKRLGISGAMNFSRNMTRGLDGFGYDDLSVMQATSQYQNVTGRSGNLQEQMRAILSTGRRYGWDIGQATSTFSDAFSSGVTGGSSAQMNPAQFATLVANATVQAHMQGREAQVVNQLAQVTQMSMQSMGNAGDSRTMASFLAMGNRTGNQALIGNLPSMISSIDQGISNPSGSYGAQAMMMRAIGGGRMSFWQEQYLQSQGAFGQEEDANGNKIGPTNIEKATDYLMNAFKGDKYRQYNMIGQMFNLKPAQAKQYIDAYTQGGKFKTDALNDIRSQMSTPVADVPLSDADKYKVEQQHKQTGADTGAGQSTTGIRSFFDNIMGNVLDSPVGSAIGMGMSFAGPISLGINAIGMLRWLKGMRGGAGAAAGAAGAAGGAAEAGGLTALEAGGAAGAGAAGAGGLLSTLAPLLMPLAMFGIAQSNKSALDQHIEDVKKKYGITDGKTSDSVYGPSYDPKTSASATGATLAPIVASTIIALQPYMSQIKSVLGSDSSSSSHYAPNGVLSSPRLMNPLLSPSSGGAGVILAGLSGGRSKGASGASRSVPAGAYSGAGHSITGNSGVSASAIDQMLKGTSLEGHGQDFIDAAGEYGIDPAALVGIVRAEQSFTNPYGSNNLTGLTSDMGLGDGRMFGANDGQALPGFKSIKDGLRATSKNLSNYANSGITGVGDVAKKWVGNSNWTNEANTINKTIDELTASKMGGSSGIPAGKIKIDAADMVITLNTESGSKRVQAPISAEYTGIA